MNPNFEMAAPQNSIVDQEQFLISDNNNNNNNNNNTAKKPAWNKPSSAAAVAAMMEAESWPALSELPRGSPKLSSTDSPTPHGLSNVSQGIAVGSLNNDFATTTISTQNNNVGSPRQRSTKRLVLGVGANSTHSTTPSPSNQQQQPPLQPVVLEPSPSNPRKSPGDNSSRDRDTGQRGGGSYEHQRFRRTNSGPLLRDASHHQTRRDQERGKKEWTVPSRSFGSRENNHGSHQRVAASRPFMRGPSPSPNSHFISPAPPSLAVRPFVTPMIYTEVPSPMYYMHGPHPDSLGHVPMMPLSPMFFPMLDPTLPSKIVYQIDYYFSNENLVKDTYLRKNMDSEGWVPIKLIAGFKKVKLLTDNIQLILDAVQASSVVEVQGDKVRRKHDWSKWIMQSSATSPQPLHKSSPDMLAAHFNSVALEEKTAT